MNRLITRTAAGVAALTLAPAAMAGTAPYFTPLTHSEAVTAPHSIDEQQAPWQAPAGMAQRNLTSMEEIEADVAQSVQRIAANASSSMFDMLAFEPGGHHVFIPHETPVGAGVTRYDIANDKAELLFAGDQQGAGPDGALGTADDNWVADFGAFDPARYTPNDTLILAEEWSGLGRVIELCNAMGPAPADPSASALTEGDCAAGADWRTLPIARVSHEGINFSRKHPNRVLYFIDEDRSGAIYKMALATPGDYARGGQTFALVTPGYLGDATANWNAGNNATPAVLNSRFGLAKWVPITDPSGGKLADVTDPLAVDPADLGCEDHCGASDIRPGRIAADDVGATPFGRPEDTVLRALENGNEMLYVTTTSENGIISIEETTRGPLIRAFASENGAPTGTAAGTPKNLHMAPTTGTLNSPDNLAVDALGNVYVVEDAPNDSAIGGDVWFARDMDDDGVAESLDHMLSLRVAGAEATGMVFNPADPTRFVIAVQHPTTTDLSDADNDGVRDTAGRGDAIWEFDISATVPPECGASRHDCITRPGPPAGLPARPPMTPTP